MPANWAHLVSRFFATAAARPLDGPERIEVEGWLREGERAAFFSQPPPDQRHGTDAARAVAGVHPERPDVIRAALLHDLGKRHSRLGIIGRSLASAWSKLGGSGWGRWATYLDHGELGASELEAWGAEQLVWLFARHHHGQRPEEISPGDWETLQAADRERRWGRARPR